MKVLDLFAGLCGWSKPFADRGHDVFSIDLDERFDVSLHADLLTFPIRDLPWHPDIVLASPPCEGLTVMNIGKNWGRGGKFTATDANWHAPKSDSARMGLRLVEATREIIAATDPTYFVIENPRGKLRKLPVLADLDRRTVWYCHLGRTNAKPTDLWGGFPPSLVLPPGCHNRRADHPADCCCRDHANAPRGSRTPGSIQGVKGKDADAARAEIPEKLATLVCLAAEYDLEHGSPRWQEQLFA